MIESFFGGFGAPKKSAARDRGGRGSRFALIWGAAAFAMLPTALETAHQNRVTSPAGQETANKSKLGLATRKQLVK